MILVLAGIVSRRTSLAWTSSTLSSLTSWSSHRLSSSSPHQQQYSSSAPLHAKAGSFFNEVPDPDADDDSKQNDPPKDELKVNLENVLKQHRKPSKAQRPSTINGVPSSEAGKGFGKPKLTQTVMQYSKKESKTYVGIGPPSLNDPSNPAIDDQGYTLYTDEQTGEKSRVFEALVEYPCLFTMKIVGANEGAFVTDMLSIVANTCEVEIVEDIDHTVKVNGKWTSVTVQAPVKSATMLYELYENVDRDPRVKFKF